MRPLVQSSITTDRWIMRILCGAILVAAAGTSAVDESGGGFVNKAKKQLVTPIPYRVMTPGRSQGVCRSVKGIWFGDQCRSL